VVASRARVAVLVGLSGVGVVLSGWLIWIHFSLMSSPGAGSACNLGGYFNCDAVSASRFATAFDVPIAYAGLLYYLLLGLLGAADLRRVSRSRALAYARGLGPLSVLYSAILAAISLGLIRAFCIFCVALYVVNVGIVALGWLKPAPRPGFWKTLALDLRAVAGGFSLWPVQIAVVLALSGAVMLATTERRLAERALASTIDAQIGEFNAAPGHSEGHEGAVLTVVEFSDFQCKFCRKVHSTFDELRDEFRGQVRFIFKHFPLDRACNRATPRGGHTGSCGVADAAVCAGEQGRFWEFQGALFDAGSPVDALDPIAESAGLDVSAWRQCRFSRAARATVERDIEEGVQAGVKVTPTFIIGERLIAGARSRADFAAIIREELAAVQEPPGWRAP